mmetsp:Transcript_33828/g.111895  ORF Transcript_33828/g.111895 Transcript_33828/m.111895 type:complete len:204 (-) Transcript_33828:104-715(-)
MLWSTTSCSWGTTYSSRTWISCGERTRGATSSSRARRRSTCAGSTTAATGTSSHCTPTRASSLCATRAARGYFGARRSCLGTRSARSRGSRSRCSSTTTSTRASSSTSSASASPTGRSSPSPAQRLRRTCRATGSWRTRAGQQTAPTSGVSCRALTSGTTRAWIGCGNEPGRRWSGGDLLAKAGCHSVWETVARAGSAQTLPV